MIIQAKKDRIREGWSPACVPPLCTCDEGEGVEAEADDYCGRPAILERTSFEHEDVAQVGHGSQKIKQRPQLRKFDIHPSRSYNEPVSVLPIMIIEARGLRQWKERVCLSRAAFP